MKWFSAQAQAPSNKQPQGCNHRKHLLIDSSHSPVFLSRKKPRGKKETKRNARAPSAASRYLLAKWKSKHRGECLERADGCVVKRK